MKQTIKDTFPLNIEKPYEPRWIKQKHVIEIINLWHLSKAYLSGGKKEFSRYERLIWTSKEFSKKYDYLSATAAYKDLDCLTKI